MLKYLWVYSAGGEREVQWHEKLIKARQEAGYDVIGFCCTPKYLNKMQWLSFPELDKMWNMGYPPLIKMYRNLLDALKDRNVLIHYNGANLHPRFVEKLDIYKVYTAGDDPESTEILTKPVAKYYDLHLINNIACVDMYKEWGLKKVFFWPLGSLYFPEEISLTKQDILDISKRNFRLVYIGEMNNYKRSFFEMILKKYPEAECWGSGWPKGKISNQDMYNLYISSQVGFNIHNSTGPINFRTYELPAFGIMQICDNKENLDKIFALEEEAVGFDSAEECIIEIDKYLSDTKRQRDIALAGWQRWKRDYTPMAVWNKMVFYIETNFEEKKGIDFNSITNLLNSQENKYSHNFWRNSLDRIKERFM